MKRTLGTLMILPLLHGHERGTAGEQLVAQLWLVLVEAIVLDLLVLVMSVVYCACQLNAIMVGRIGR